jgi:hypothetical protein
MAMPRSAKDSATMTRFERRGSIVERSFTLLSHRLRSTTAILPAFLVPLGVYVASLQGDVAGWDTADLQTVPYILGIPYPTGFPGYVLLGWAWSHALALGSVAWRLNLLDAVASAGTAAALAALLLEFGAAAPIAFAAACAYALAGIPWSHATFVDVHPIAFCAIAWSAVFALRWGRGGGLRDAAAGVAAATAALACDNTTLLMLPGLALIAFARRPPLRFAAVALAVAIAAIAATYAYLPLRSAAVTAQRIDPTLALGVPPGRPYWDDGHPATWAGFRRVVTGSDFHPQAALAQLAGPRALDAFSASFAPRVARELGWAFASCALGGWVLLAGRKPQVAAGLALLGIVPVLFAGAYVVESVPARYFLPAYFALAAAAGYAVAGIDAALTGPRRAALLGALAVAWAAQLVVDLRAGALLFDQPADRSGSAWIALVAAATPPRAIVVARWNAATTLAYGAYVQHALGDRIILTAGAHEFQASYRRWIARRPLVVVSAVPLTFPGFRVRDLGDGDPHLYALR